MILARCRNKIEFNIIILGMERKDNATYLDLLYEAMIGNDMKIRAQQELLNGNPPEVTHKLEQLQLIHTELSNEINVCHM